MRWASPCSRACTRPAVRAVLLRCAGFNNVDLLAAERLGLFVANVPSYSPEAVAEFALALLQTLNRNTHRAYNRVREGNFNLDGLLGRTLHGKTVGVVGVGRIGLALARILKGFGCRLLAYDPYPSEAFAQYGDYVALDELLSRCDFVSLHCPLMDSTRHIINEESLEKMKKGAILLNTSRGGLIDTKAVIAALKSKHLGGPGPGRVRERGHPLLQRPLRRHHRRRRAHAPDDLPQRHRVRAPGLLHRRGADRDRRVHAPEHGRLYAAAALQELAGP